MLWVQGILIDIEARPDVATTITFTANDDAACWTIWGGANEVDDLWLIAEEAKLERERKEIFRAFVDGLSPLRVELEPEQPPARAIVRRRVGLRASARGVRNWRPRRDTV